MKEKYLQKHYNKRMAESIATVQKRQLKEEKIKNTPLLNKQKISRNAPCTCGSGKKYKHCHGKVA